MVVCKRCGNQNPLGRVFCVKCGTKLDLTHMTSEHVQEIQKNWSDPLVKYWPKAAAAVFVIILLLVGLACWPRTTLFGKTGTRVDGRRVDNALASFKNMRAGETRNAEIKEEDVNGYFQFIKIAKNIGLDSVTVSIQENRVFVRVIKPLPSLSVPKYNLTPKMSYDLQCVPSGGALVPVSVQVGHLSLFGPLKSSALRNVHAVFASQPEWLSLKPINDIKCTVGKMSIQAKK